MKRTGFVLTLFAVAPFLVVSTVHRGFAQDRTVTEERRITTHRESTTVTTPIPVPSTAGMVVEQPPPLPREETMPTPPSPTQVWVPGHWTWNNGWQWQAGHFEQPPERTAAWVPGQWIQQGQNWVWQPGRWQ
jgi:hypothetical protein